MHCPSIRPLKFNDRDGGRAQLPRTRPSRIRHCAAVTSSLEKQCPICSLTYIRAIGNRLTSISLRYRDAEDEREQLTLPRVGCSSKRCRPAQALCSSSQANCSQRSEHKLLFPTSVAHELSGVMHKLSAPRPQLLLVRVIFIACVAVLIGNVLRFTVNLLALNPAMPQRGAAREALVNMHRLLQLVIDAETGERVFRVAGKRAQLEPYRAARDRYGEVMEAVELQMHGSPSQIASLLHLRALLATRFDHQESSVAVSDHRRVGPGGTNALIQRIQALVDEMEGEQMRSLAPRDGRSAPFVWTTLAAGLTINALVLALLALLYSMIRSSFTPHTELGIVRALQSRPVGKRKVTIDALAGSGLPQAT